MHSLFPAFLEPNDKVFLESLPFKNINDEYEVYHTIADNLFQAKCRPDHSSIGQAGERFMIKTVPIPSIPTQSEKDLCNLFIASLRSTYTILLQPHNEVVATSSPFMSYKDLFISTCSSQVDESYPQIVLVYYLIPGSDLVDWADSHICDDVDIQEYINITYSLLTSLHILHTLGIMHRDIKPENIVYDPKKEMCKRLKIIDFDFACSRELCRNSPGTKLYSGFSVLLGETDPDVRMRADIVAAAVTIYRLITGDYETLVPRLSLKTVKNLKDDHYMSQDMMDILTFLLPLFVADRTFKRSLSDIIHDFEEKFTVNFDLKSNYMKNVLHYLHTF